ncbi:hypothetical protein [Komagataeibacter diospyri]|uniref:hypothetical protein n=1 Tax=Komagataeibacter diospyri TaxID=1932662 RepID=UPI0011431313|nr:hypothetical protein [Komagataeibacter diospyri]
MSVLNGICPTCPRGAGYGVNFGRQASRDRVVAYPPGKPFPLSRYVRAGGGAGLSLSTRWVEQGYRIYE